VHIHLSALEVINPLKTTEIHPGIVSAESRLVLRSTEVQPALGRFVFGS
jgi:hypothetical protein